MGFSRCLGQMSWSLWLNPLKHPSNVSTWHSVHNATVLISKEHFSGEVISTHSPYTAHTLNFGPVCSVCGDTFLVFLVIFPMDILEKGFWASNFAMLGLGDIVVPGQFCTFRININIIYPRIYPCIHAALG